MTEKCLILGGGYVGSRLAQQLEAVQTYCSNEKSVAQECLYFNLQDRQSWNNIQPGENVVWTFPAAPLEQVKAFYRAKLSNVNKLFVYASSSCYLVLEQGQWINESQSLNLSRERVLGEEWLREQGATILVLSGIYGPNRQPLDWLKKGLIKTPDKRVNLIHVDDITDITKCLLSDDRNLRGERFNLSDGKALMWREIAEHFEITLPFTSNNVDSKMIDNEKICSWLGGYRFRSLF